MATINAKELAALAFAAYRFNNGFIKDSTKWDNEKETFVTVNPNKTLMRNTILQSEGQVFLTVTDEDSANADEALNALHGDITLKLLTGKLVSEFTQNLNNLFTKEKLTASDTGLAAWLPEMYARIQKDQSTKEQMFELSASSEFLGAIDKKITVDFTMISSRFLRDYNCYSVFGHDSNGNCVMFFTRHTALAKSGKVTGKVKKHSIDAYHNNAKVTTINYVKEAQ